MTSAALLAHANWLHLAQLLATRGQGSARQFDAQGRILVALAYPLSCGG